MDSDANMVLSKTSFYGVRAVALPCIKTGGYMTFADGLRAAAEICDAQVMTLDAYTVRYLSRAIRAAIPPAEGRGEGLTVEQVEEWRAALNRYLPPNLRTSRNGEINALCDLAIAALRREQAEPGNLAGEAIDMFLEYRDKHGRNETIAKHMAVLEFNEAYAAPAAPVKGADELRDAVSWILEDAAYKAPELIGDVAMRWIVRLNAALREKP